MKKLLFTRYTLAVIICIIGILIFNAQTLFPILSILILLCFMYPLLNYYYIFKQKNAINQFYQILHKYSKITIYPTITIFIIAFLAQNCYIINYFKNQDMLNNILKLAFLFIPLLIWIFLSSLDKHLKIIKNNQFDTTIPPLSIKQHIASKLTLTIFLFLPFIIVFCFIVSFSGSVKMCPHPIIDTFTDSPQTSTSSSITIKDGNITQEPTQKVINHKEELVL